MGLFAHYLAHLSTLKAAREAVKRAEKEARDAKKREEEAERAAKMLKLNVALLAHGLPPFEAMDLALRDVLTANYTRLTTLTNGRADAPLIDAEVEAAVRDCAVVQPRLDLVDAALAAQDMPRYRTLKQPVTALLRGDKKLQAVFDPAAVFDAAAIPVAIARLKPEMLRRGARELSSASNACASCGGSAASACSQGRCGTCCTRVHCPRHR